MIAPNLLRGFLYPSQFRQRCPRHHACIISQKCQNFDRHNRECIACESRLIDAGQSNIKFGGFVAEGTYSPDLQDAIKTVQDNMQMAVAHPDREFTQSSRDIVNQGTRFRKAQEKIMAFSNMMNLDMEETITDAWYDPEKRKFLGRLE